MERARELHPSKLRQERSLLALPRACGNKVLVTAAIEYVVNQG